MIYHLSINIEIEFHMFLVCGGIWRYEPMWDSIIKPAIITLSAAELIGNLISRLKNSHREVILNRLEHYLSLLHVKPYNTSRLFIIISCTHTIVNSIGTLVAIA